jgi:hypothetical protein
MRDVRAITHLQRFLQHAHLRITQVTSSVVVPALARGVVAIPEAGRAGLVLVLRFKVDTGRASPMRKKRTALYASALPLLQPRNEGG